MRDLYQRFELRHAGDNFVQRDNDFGRPDAIFFERHEFDETHDDVFFAREDAEGNDLVFVESAEQHTIDLHRIETGTAGGANAGENALISVRYARDAGEEGWINGVQADFYKVEARIFL